MQRFSPQLPLSSCTGFEHNLESKGIYNTKKTCIKQTNPSSCHTIFAAFLHFLGIHFLPLALVRQFNNQMRVGGLRL